MYISPWLWFRSTGRGSAATGHCGNNVRSSSRYGPARCRPVPGPPRWTWALEGSSITTWTGWFAQPRFCWVTVTAVRRTSHLPLLGLSAQRPGVVQHPHQDPAEGDAQPHPPAPSSRHGQPYNRALPVLRSPQLRLGGPVHHEETGSRVDHELPARFPHLRDGHPEADAPGGVAGARDQLLDSQPDGA